MTEQFRKAEERLKAIEQKLGNKKLSNKDRKKLKQTQRKIANDEKKRNPANNESPDSECNEVLGKLEALTI